MNRHSFVKAASCGALLMGVLSPVSHTAAESRPPILGSLGMLHDSTSCVGCRACITKCQDINFPEHNPQGERTWLNSDKLSSYTNNIIQVWASDAGVNKNQKESGYVYVKKQCIRYVDPNCISVCPVSTLKKDPKTDIVHYDKDVYIGCHYYMVACLYSVPKYNYNSPFNALHKRKSCSQKGVERLDKGGLPDCIEVYPAGAVAFGTRGELMTGAKKRLALKPGSEYHYPRRTLKSDDTYLHTVPKHYPHLYGEKEDSGTQVLVLTGVSYENLDLSKLDDPSIDAHSEHIQYALCKGMMLPLAVLADLAVLVRRNTKNDHHDGGDDHGSWSTTARRQNHQ